MIIFVIKNLREEKGISLYELSKRTGLSRTFLRDIENNKNTNPTIASLEKIAVVLNVNLKKLFFSELDISLLKKKMYRYIDKYGINSPEVLQISQLIDLLLNADKK